MRKILALLALVSLSSNSIAGDLSVENITREQFNQVLQSFEAPMPDLPSNKNNKIVGGSPAVKGEFPFIVSLQHSYYGHFCGGSIIKKNWVLTAAHCVDGISPSSIVAGLTNLSDTTGVEKFKPLQIIKHPGWNSQIMDNDYALIKLSGDTTYPAVKLNTKDIPSNTVFTVMGWGVTSESGSISRNLLKVDVPVVDNQTCSLAYPDSITDTMVCAGYKEGGKDSCQGDSGGPLVINKAGNITLAGVVSWGEGCARPNKYGVYSNVAKVLEWIETTTK